MRCPNKTENEIDRLKALKDYGLEREKVSNLDPIVTIAATMFGCPSAAVNIIGDEHVFLTSSHGIDDYDPRRDVSFCAHAITQDGVMVVEDATLDPRFHDNPIVTNGFIRFYAGVPLRSVDGHALGALCIIDDKPRARFTPAERLRLKEVADLVQDKLELRRLQVAAKSVETQFSAGAATSPNAVLCFDTQTKITAWNDAATLMFGKTADEMIGHSIFEIIAARDHRLVTEAIGRVMDGGIPKAEGTELTGVRASGETFTGELQWSYWYEDGKMHFGTIVRDVTEKKRNRDALYQLANYDSLTGLPNRNLFQTLVSQALSEKKQLSIVMADLDGFSDINSTLGHSVGDAVLQTVAKRIQALSPRPDTVFRVGCDDFVLLLEGPPEPTKVHEFANSVCDTIAEPMPIDRHMVHVVGSCGIALAPDHGESIEALMGSAELALFQARSRGRGKAFLFIPALRAEAVARRMYDAELHRALERKEFCVFYQPQIRLSDGALVGAEALIRWQHPVRGLLAPAAFLPSLEDSVLTEAVGQWALDTACAQAAHWQNMHPQFRMSVNLFSAQFRSGRLPQQVFDTLKAYELSPQALELEITENIILDQQDSLLRQLEALHEAGVTLSFDDFGTGYASLNLLRDYPVSLIKIDKSFTQVVQTSPKDRAIVTFLIDLARKLGLGVVAEGIENAEDLEFLKELGCEKGQGYLFSKPVPAAVFTELMLTAQSNQRPLAV